VTKEILRVNEEILLAVNWALVITCGYVVAGDQVADLYRQAEAEDKKFWTDATEFELALVEEAIKINEVAVAKPEVIETYLKQYQEASVGYEHAQRLLAQLALRDSVEAKLVAVRDQEARAEREAREKMAAGARDWLLAKFQSSPQLRASVLDRAIQNIGQSKRVGTLEKDPVAQLFREYIAQSKKQLKA